MKDDVFTARAIKLKRVRLFIAGGLVFIFMGLVVGRLFYLQVVDYRRYTEYSRNMYYQKVTFSPTRGRILDRNMVPLALSVPQKSVFVSPSMVRDKRAVSMIVARDLELDPETVYQKVNRPGHFVWLKRKVDESAYAALKQRRLRGVQFVPEDRRFYPQRTMASRVMGFCGLDNNGLAGLEYLYDRTLSGEQVTIVAQKDAMGKIYGYNGEKRPESNFELVTTLDSNIQYLAEKAVKAAMEKHHAKSGIAIVMDVADGGILAMSEQPELDLNNPLEHLGRHRSLSATQSYEPGSIFKIFVAAGAINEGLATPDKIYDCENGKYELYDHVFREAKGNKYGLLPLRDVIANSSNIGMIKLAQEMGEPKVHHYLSRFGFGRKTGVDLPGEVEGLLRDYHKWSGVAMASISFGQEVNVTPVQISAALSTLGNGGVMVRPHFFRQVLKDGRVVREYAPPAAQRVVSQKAADAVVEMMSYAVSDGTGRHARVTGFGIAGKTGTAQKFDNELNRYSNEKTLSSFVALFPAERPRYSILVMIDEPDGAGWGGEVAAPVAKQIIAGMATYVGMPARGQRHYDVDWSGVRARLSAGRRTYAQPVSMAQGKANPLAVAGGPALSSRVKDGGL